MPYFSDWKHFSPSFGLKSVAMASGVGAVVVAAALVYLLTRPPERTISIHRKILSTYDPSEIYGSEALEVKRIPFSDDGKKAAAVSEDEAFSFGAGEESGDRFFISYQQGSDAGSRPTLIFFPGTGFISREKVSDAFCKSLAVRYPGLQIIMINMRLAPEFKYPIPHDDAELMTKFLLDHAGDFNIDKKRLFLAGYSSGANFAFNVASMLRNEPSVAVLKLLLVSPFVNFNLSRIGMWQVERDTSIAKGFVKRIIAAYAGPHPSDDPRLSPFFMNDLQRFPSTRIIIGKGDYVKSDSEKLLRLLNATVQSETAILTEVDNGGITGHGAFWKVFSAVVNTMAGDLQEFLPITIKPLRVDSTWQSQSFSNPTGSPDMEGMKF